MSIVLLAVVGVLLLPVLEVDNWGMVVLLGLKEEEEEEIDVEGLEEDEKWGWKGL